MPRKLYCGTTSRLCKKKLGSLRKKLLWAKDLKPGDIVATCIGFNEIVTKIEPEWTNHGLRRGRYIFGFCIYTERGSMCSATACCSPAESVDEILSFWRRYHQFYPNATSQAIVHGGEKMFDERGCLLPENWSLFR